MAVPPKQLSLNSTAPRRRFWFRLTHSTSAPIAKALVDAKNRGVYIEVVLDKSQKSEKYSSADFVAHAGIPVNKETS
jgi:hypothetical protein